MSRELAGDNDASAFGFTDLHAARQYRTFAQSSDCNILMMICHVALADVITEAVKFTHTIHASCLVVCRSTLL